MTRGQGKKIEWTKKEVSFLINNYHLIGNKEIAKILNCKEARIQRKAEKLDLKKPKGIHYKDHPKKAIERGGPSILDCYSQKIIELYLKNLCSKEAIAKMFGCCVETVDKLLKKHKIKQRTPKEARSLATKKWRKRFPPEYYIQWGKKTFEVHPELIERLIKWNKEHGEDSRKRMIERIRKNPELPKQLGKLMHLKHPGLISEIARSTHKKHPDLAKKLGKITWSNILKKSKLPWDKRLIDGKFLSKLEKKFNDILRGMGFRENEDYVINKPINIKLKDKTQVITPDFRFKKEKVIFEVMGEIWHYKDEKETNDTKKRLKLIEEYTVYKVYEIREKDILKDPSKVRNQIEGYLKIKGVK